MWAFPTADYYGLNLCLVLGLPRWLKGKESACNAEDAGSIPGSRRSPGEGNGNPLQYSCLGNPVKRGDWRATVHWIAKSQTGLKWLSLYTLSANIQFCTFFLFPFFVSLTIFIGIISCPLNPIIKTTRTSLVIQWLRLRAPRAGGLGFYPWSGSQIPHGTTKDFACPNEDGRSHVLHLRPSADK